jgi:hypothetical protein
MNRDIDYFEHPWMHKTRQMLLTATVKTLHALIPHPLLAVLATHFDPIHFYSLIKYVNNVPASKPPFSYQNKDINDHFINVHPPIKLFKEPKVDSTDHPLSGAIATAPPDVFEVVSVGGFDPEVNDPELMMVGGVLTLFQSLVVELPVVSRLDCHNLLLSTLRFLEFQLLTFHCSYPTYFFQCFWASLFYG